MEIITGHRDAIRVICLRRVGPYSDIDDAFAELEAFLADCGVSADGKERYGLYLDDPEDAESRPADLRSDICISIPENEDLKQVEVRHPGALPAGYSIHMIPEGDYAQGILSGLQVCTISAWSDIFTWLETTDRETDGDYCIEAYGALSSLEDAKEGEVLMLLKVRSAK